MRWQDRPESDNVEDRRSDGSSGFNLPSSSNQRVRMGGYSFAWQDWPECDHHRVDRGLLRHRLDAVDHWWRASDDAAAVGTRHSPRVPEELFS